MIAALAIETGVLIEIVFKRRDVKCANASLCQVRYNRVFTISEKNRISSSSLHINLSLLRLKRN